MIDKLTRFYRLLNTLSIDVALGAICCAAWFAVLFNVNLRPYALLSLGLTVWIIYTIDHLLDARKVKGLASTERHRFHQQNFTPLLVVLGIAVATDVILIFFIRKVVFQAGIVLSIVMVAYFLMQRYLRYVKEFSIAFLFSCGVLLPSWSLSQTRPDGELTLIIVLFILTALINLLLFSWFDFHNDRQDNRESFVTLIGETKAKRILSLLFMTNAILMIVSTVYSSLVLNSIMIIFFMNLMLIWIFVQRKQFEVNERFRLAGDCIFLFPSFYLLL